MLIGKPADVAFAVQSVEAVQGGFVRGDAAAFLDFADKRIAMVLRVITLDEIQNRLLFVR